jgi:mannose-6-phosphate isomerase-like protein (cupin superfamily)
VVLVTGSGPQDRDECVLGIRPFRQLADHLARHGVATLRYDDRGTARSTGDFAAATAADFADDAEAAVRFLATRTDVDPKKVGVLGHSEGGAIAPMIAARDKAESVKALVEELKSQNRREAVEHRRIYRPWGYYQGVDNGTRYQVQRIVVKPGARLSLQKHFHRAEHWVVVKGTAEVTVGADVRAVHENESVYIPIGSVHRLANPGKIPLELIEVQVGSYLGEDDIQRLDDTYGRG